MKHTTRDHLTSTTLPTPDRVQYVLCTNDLVLSITPILRHSKGGIKWWKGAQTTERYGADGPEGYGLIRVTLLNAQTGRRWRLKVSAHAFGDCEEGIALRDWSGYPHKAEWARNNPE